MKLFKTIVKAIPEAIHFVVLIVCLGYSMMGVFLIPLAALIPWIGPVVAFCALFAAWDLLICNQIWDEQNGHC